jgi:hypothetical protein
LSAKSTGLILASLVAAYFEWSLPAANGKSIVWTVGTVPAALPGFHIPEFNFDWISRLLPGAVAISFLGLLEALAHVYARQSSLNQFVSIRKVLSCNTALSIAPFVWNGPMSVCKLSTRILADRARAAFSRAMPGLLPDSRRMDDMMVVDHMAVFAAGLGRPATPRGQQSRGLGLPAVRRFRRRIDSLDGNGGDNQSLK